MNYRVPLFRVHNPDWNILGPELKRVMSSGYWAEGVEVAEFEKELVPHVGSPHVFATASCTAALTLALKASGVAPGDVVVAPAMTCVATVAPVVALGAKVLWCDVDPYTGLLDIERGLMNPDVKPKALIGVDWGGDILPTERIGQWCKANGIAFIEDAAQAFGTQTVGADYRCFSFQAIKMLTTGDGGCVVASDAAKADLGKRLSWFGINRSQFRLPNGEINWDLDIPTIGFKANMNNVQAAIGRVQLRYVPALLETARRNVVLYEQLLAGVDEVHIPKRHGQSAHWVFTVTCKDRDGLMRYLHNKGIQASRMHARLDRYTGIAAVDSRRLPGVDYFAEHVLCLPCGWWVTLENVAEIVGTIKSFYGKTLEGAEDGQAENKSVMPDNERGPVVVQNDHPVSPQGKRGRSPRVPGVEQRASAGNRDAD